MNIKERIYRYKNYNGVQHARYNPEGQGIVKIQLIPSKKSFKIRSDIVILNNKIIIPIAPAWSILLSNFMRNLNENTGKVIDSQRLEECIINTINDVSKIYVTVPKKMLTDDLNTILNVFNSVAYGKNILNDIGQQTIAQYSKYMIGPHKVYFMLNNVDSKSNKHCNNRCLHYSEPLKDSNGVKEIDTEDWKTIINKCHKACIPHIVFTGGKPTERKDLIELIEASKWFVTTLNCTGKNLTREFCKRLSDASLDNVAISLYSYNKEIHNKLANEDNYDLVVQGIRNAVEANLFVNLHIAICKLNSDVLETIKFAFELGVKSFSISVMDCNADNRNNFGENELTKNDVYEILKNICEYTDKHYNDIDIHFESPNFIDNKMLESINIDPPVCGACLYEIAIMPNGMVMPCINLSDEKYILGNMLVDSWKQIWENMKCKKIRNISLENVSNCPIKRYIQK